jgi:hypothetical protein
MSAELPIGLNPPPENTKAIPRRTQVAIQLYPDDGKPRFTVKGSLLAFKLAYGPAYEETFLAAGGRFAPGLSPGKRGPRIWSREGIRRITRLNRIYLSQPGVQEFMESVIESHRAAADLLKKPLPVPCETPSPSSP